MWWSVTDMVLDGRKVVITGGASGIGFAAARLAASKGASVILLGRTESKLETAVNVIGERASYYTVDVTDKEAVNAAFAAIGSLDHLLTCAAGSLVGRFADLPEEEVRDFVDVKLWGQYRCVKAALPQMSHNGSIVLVSGLLYRKPARKLSSYALVNGAVEALTRALALEIAPTRVNALVPGYIDTTPEPADEEKYQRYKESVAAKVPLGRMGTPEEAAHAALFLMENTYMTGATVDVDGGRA